MTLGFIGLIKEEAFLVTCTKMITYFINETFITHC